MHKRLALLSIALLALTLSSSPALAWGAKGHRVIGLLAQERLTATAQMEISRLLEGADLATVSTWADEMKAKPDQPEFWSSYAATWHYVDFPFNVDYTNAKKNPHGDAVLAIATFSAILLNEPLPPGGVQDGLRLYFADFDPHSTEVKRFALKFLVHILGDLQQPLHNGRVDDRGGGTVQLEWRGKSTNLHSLWDSLLLDYNDIDATTYTRRLRNRIERIPASDVRNFEAADIATWLTESGRTQQRIYARLPGAQVSEKDYAVEFVPSAELQLIKGGLRTAWFLNNIFGGWPVGTP